MRYLSQGLETQERFELLLSLTKISSDDIIRALGCHLVKGFSEEEAISHCGVTQSNFNRSLKKLNAVAEIVEKIKEIDLAPFKSVK